MGACMKVVSKISLVAVLLSSGSFLAQGCVGSVDEQGMTMEPPPVMLTQSLASFNADVLPLIQAKGCQAPGCHGDVAAGIGDHDMVVGGNYIGLEAMNSPFVNVQDGHPGPGWDELERATVSAWAMIYFEESAMMPPME